MKRITSLILGAMVTTMALLLVSCAVKSAPPGSRGDPPMPPLVSPPRPLPF